MFTITSTKPLNIEIGSKDFTEVLSGTIVLSKETAIDYFDVGRIEFKNINLGKFFNSGIKLFYTQSLNGGTLKYETATSSDGITYSAYQEINSDGTIKSPQNQYLNVKVTFTGGETTITTVLNTFDSNNSTQFVSDSQVLFDGYLRLKTSYAQTISAVTVSGMYINKFTINLDTFKSIESMGVT